jgi:enterochelin esterase family protein
MFARFSSVDILVLARVTFGDKSSLSIDIGYLQTAFHEGNMKTLIAFMFAVLFTQMAMGQQELSVNRAASGTLEPGNTVSLLINLDDGAIARLTLTQHGRVDLVSSYPDGARLRRLAGQEGDATRSFSIAAEGGGRYRIDASNPGRDMARYELVISEIVSLSERLKPGSIDLLVSPRIQTLRHEIESGRKNTDPFWSEIRERGTPLVEPFGSDTAYQLVTFLWRAVHETRNVIVKGSFAYPVSPTDLALHQLGDSDVWYRTFKFPRGSRFTYSISPNDPMTWDGPRASDRDATMQMDPLNPRRLRCPAGASKFQCISVAELPKAQSQPWIVRKPDTPQGHVETASIKSSIQTVERGLSVYTPAHYDPSGQPNALLVLFDGPAYLLPDQGTLATLDELIADSKIPPTVVVFVNNVGSHRLDDMMANSKFADFVVLELVPWIRSRYNVTKNPAQAVVGGYSASGFASAYLALRHSEIFGNVIAQSGAFWWAPDHSEGICGPDWRDSGCTNKPTDATTEPNWMAKQYIASPKLPVRFHLDAGTFEVDWYGKGGDILEQTRHLRDVLLAKGYDVHYQQVDSGHDGLNWRGTIADALIFLLGRSGPAVAR